MSVVTDTDTLHDDDYVPTLNALSRDKIWRVKLYGQLLHGYNFV